MKVRAWLATLAALAGLHSVGGARLNRARAETEAVAGQGKATLQAAIGSMVGELFAGRASGPAIKDIVRMAERKMDLGDAVRHLKGKLPEDVASLVGIAQSGATAQPFDEASLQKARNILNNMMLKGWQELDDVMFEALEFKERNRGTNKQVVSDLARLGSQLARLGELRVTAGQGIAMQDLKRKEGEETLEEIEQQFQSKLYEDRQEMSVRKSDLAVFDFVLSLTACPASSGSSASSGGSNVFIQLEARPKVQICNTSAGVGLHFSNPQLQAKMERLMTPEARLALRSALGQIAPHSFQQLQTTTAAPASTTTLSMVLVEPQPVQEEPHPEGQWKKCVDTIDGCGPLHDLMSLEWGKFRDSFDELTEEMKRNQAEHDLKKQNINSQLQVINDEKTKDFEVLANTISAINADTEAMNEKDEQKHELTLEYNKETTIFKAKINEILYTKICALRRVRNELMTHSSTSPPPDITDCDFSDWESKSGECINPQGKAILCDDTCPQPDPSLCGGTETMKRDVVVAPNQYGMVCPPLERQKKCGQKKCPVNCVLSQWSGWSKCTKECESGVEIKTRSDPVKPKNGGLICDALQEERACNTGSCDRDCTLQDWSDWTPCSMACGGGFKDRRRQVLRPIRGAGKCPKEKSRKRLEYETCNSQDCVGDEVCIAQQDLILAIDGSGSLKESGFQVVRQFAKNLTMKYKPMYFGLEAIKIGVVLFGNGQLLPQADGSTVISEAINVEPLTSDLDKVRTSIDGLQYQRGFTNMAQALSLADTMLSQGGRPHAQSAVLVMSDGKYSFKFQTAQKAQALKDKNIKIFMAPITDFEGKDLKVLKRWASSPWETNFERIPGLAALKYNAEIFVQKLLVKFCPDAMSPSLMVSRENQKQYMLIHENGWPDDSCGAWVWVGKVGSKDDCATAARNRQMKAFSFGRSYASGRCYTEAIALTQAEFDSWQADRTNPPCPGGTWLFNPFYDTFAINPATM